MRDRVRILCRPAVAAGFRLAGLQPAEAADSGDGVEDEEAGVILVQDDFYAALPDAERRALARRALPLLVPFPAPSWAPAPEGPEAFIAELLRQALGYRVRLG
jgi:vacuolar-type H+-ATPase subunit F/Vma7